MVGKGVLAGAVGALMPTFSMRPRRSKLWSLGKGPSPAVAMTWQLVGGHKGDAGSWGICSVSENAQLGLINVLHHHLLMTLI